MGWRVLKISERVCFRQEFLSGTPGSSKRGNQGPFIDFGRDICISRD